MKILKNVLLWVLLIALIASAAGIFRLRLIQLNAEQDELQEEKEAAVLAAESSPEPTPAPTPTPTPTPEPEPEFFKLSFIGDCTLWSSVQFELNDVGLPKVVGENYAYPFSNTVQYFSDDEYTFANLECTFSDTKLYSGQQFYFRAPSSYANILVEGDVDFVTTANNHTLDFDEIGAQRTLEALDAVKIPHGSERQGQVVTTKNGLSIGIYTAGNDMRPDWKTDEAVAAVKEMKAQGVDLVICMFHWGLELYYSPNDNQINLAHACIDAGADIVYGSHPHCLQPIEKYNNGIIMYSMGNWCFGGSTRPSDPDTAIVQVTIKRDVDGTISTEGFEVIPCCVSSNIEGAMNMSDNYNNYCPTPYPEDSEGYQRVMSKLDGSYQPKSQGADYSNFYASWG
ncbi:MAG: CapA family protein [Candidatus Limivicinus sp.]|jgi:hypothetical protein